MLSGMRPARLLWLARLGLGLLALLLLAGCGPAPATESPAAEHLRKARAALSGGLFLAAEAEYEEFLRQMPAGQPPAADAPAPRAAAQAAGDAAGQADAADRWEAWSRLVDIAAGVKNDPEQALAILAEMLPEYRADAGRSATILLRQGEILASMGRLEMAVESWRLGLDLPGVAEADKAGLAMRMGRARRSLGRLPQALESFETCQRLAPLWARCRYEKALTLSLAGDLPQARGILEEMLGNPGLESEDKSLAAFLLADVYARQGHADQARILLHSIRDSHPNPLAVDAKLRELQ